MCRVLEFLFVLTSGADVTEAGGLRHAVQPDAAERGGEGRDEGVLALLALLWGTQGINATV